MKKIILQGEICQNGNVNGKMKQACFLFAAVKSVNGSGKETPTRKESTGKANITAGKFSFMQHFWLWEVQWKFAIFRNFVHVSDLMKTNRKMLKFTQSKALIIAQNDSEHYCPGGGAVVVNSNGKLATCDLTTHCTSTHICNPQYGICCTSKKIYKSI